MYCTMLRVTDHFWPPVVRVTPLKTPFRLLIPLLKSQPHVTTITHNYFLRCVTFTQLTILHAVIPFLTSTHIHTSNKHSVHTSKISPRTYSANSLLKKSYKRHCSNEPGESCVASLAEKRRSPTPVAGWRHSGMLRRNRIPILLRDVIASARKSCLPAGA
jgi:hypothetical protein